MATEQRRTVESFSDHGSMMRMAALRIVDRAAEAIAHRGRFLLALSGGSTPRLLYELLATPAFAARIAWPQTHLFWGDERCVGPDHPDSNYRLARAVLLDHVPLPAENIHRIRGEDEPATAAATYEALLRSYIKPPAGFDLVLLGMGADGHTASLFPGSAATREGNRWAVATPGPSGEGFRITLTPAVINAAAEVVFLVSGVEKADRLREVLEGGPELLPAQLIRPTRGELHWMVDAAAAGRLSVGCAAPAGAEPAVEDRR